jgi:hypothetical protein
MHFIPDLEQTKNSTLDQLNLRFLRVTSNDLRIHSQDLKTHKLVMESQNGQRKEEGILSHNFLSICFFNHLH